MPMFQKTSWEVRNLKWQDVLWNNLMIKVFPSFKNLEFLSGIIGCLYFLPQLKLLNFKSKLKII